METEEAHQGKCCPTQQGAGREIHPLALVSRQFLKDSSWDVGLISPRCQLWVTEVCSDHCSKHGAPVAMKGCSYKC